jgi:hypothetical protein
MTIARLQILPLRRSATPGTSMKNKHIIGAAALVATLSLIAGERASAQTLLVPAYFLPGPDWTAMTAAAASGASITAIMNPDSGPGAAQDPTYLAAVDAFELAGGTVLGYVSTSDARRSLSAVEADVKSYESFYPVNGFFLDQMTDDTKSSHLNYYQNLYAFIKGQNSSYDVVGNPGTSVPSNYASLADTLVTYEDVGSNYPSNTAVTWSSSEPASKFANIAYEVPDAANMFQDLAEAQSQNVGYVYFTDDGADGNPYDSLPSYFSQEAAAMPEPKCAALCVFAAVLLNRRVCSRRRMHAPKLA